MKYGIHWFRRDLRIAGNLALQQNWKQNEGRVLGIFCFDKSFLSRPDFSRNRFAFFLKTLKSLKNELRKIGSDLLVLDQMPKGAFQYLIEELSKKKVTLPELITWNRDYEPFARNRDGCLETFFDEKGIATKTARDHLLIEPHELKKASDGGFYSVYTPFSRQWLNLFQTQDFQDRVKQQKQSFVYYENLKNGNSDKILKLSWKRLSKGLAGQDKLNQYLENNTATIPLPKAGSLNAILQLETFKKKLKNYKANRDCPDLQATSGLSVFLKNGSLSVSQIIYFLKLKYYSKGDPSGEATFLSELIWREFYYHILYHRPEVEHNAFQAKFAKLDWKNSSKYFKAWKEGMTGFPIVDAGMRQLKETGLMHNRVRMIVASFLVKDLLIDWRKGEQHFMETLLDGDLAANNGGWQWAASTGCDAQPYFRIFNPWSQSKKFDSEGKYIKTYIPELKGVEAKQLHEPILNHKVYPKPIVDHSVQRLLAIELFKKAHV